MKGKVMKFVDKRGFGFIGMEGEKEDIYFHCSELPGFGHKTIAEGARVEFDIEDTEKGKVARHIRTL